MRNLLAVQGAADKPNTKFKNIEDIMRDPAMKAKLNNLVDEAVRCKQEIYKQQQAIKDIRDVARNDVALNPKLFNYYVAMVFANDYAARKENVDQLETLIDTVMRLGGMVDDAPNHDD